MKKLLIILAIVLIITPVIAAWEFDNVKDSYNSETREVVIKDSLLGIPTTLVAKLRLDTPHKVVVNPGYVKIFQYTSELNENAYDNPFKLIEFYDYEKNLKQVDKQIDLKYISSYKEVDVPVYTYPKSCDKAICPPEVSYKKVQEPIWSDYTATTQLKGNITISGWATMNPGEHLEWIPTFYGVRIPEWAEVATQRIPEMTANDAPSPYIAYASGSGGVSGGEPYNAYDKNDTFPGAHWSSAASCSGGCTNTYIAIDVSAGNAFVPSNVTLRNSASGTSDIRDFFVEACNDNSSEANWVKLLWVDDQPNSVGNWTYNFSNNTNSYRHIRINVTDNYGATAVHLEELYIWGTDASTPPTITIVAPENNSNETSNPVIFNATVTDNSGVSNVSLFLNGEHNNTDTSGTNGTYTWSLNMADGDHNWSVGATDDDGTTENSSVYLFSVDTTDPAITNQNITETDPDGMINYSYNGDTLTFTWNVTDANIDTCWYQFNVTNTTVTCSDNTTDFPLDDFYDNNLTFYANDTFGNEANVYVTWNYVFFYESAVFNTTTVEGATETYTAYVVTNGTAITLASLQWNGTNYTGAISNSGNNYTLTDSLAIPDVASETSLLFNWSFTAGGLTREGESNNVTVSAFSVDNCSTNSNVLYNFTIVDEETQDELNETGDNTTADINLQIYTLGRGSEIVNFSQSFNQTNPFAICLNSTSGEYNIDVEINYDADGYASEFYNIQNDTLNSADFPTNITLYDLDDNDAQEFHLLIRDDAFLPLNDALVEVQRKYVDEGLYKIVEIPKTDNNGETVAWLVVDDVIYTFRIIYYGEVIATFSNVRAVCQTPTVTPCEIDFNAFSSGLTVPDWESDEDFNYTLGFDSATNSVTADFLIPSGSPSLILLNVTREDALGTAVCTDSITSSSGTLECVVPSSFGNATVLAKLYKDGDFQAQGNVKVNQDPSDIYGGVAVFLAFFLMITLIGAGVSNNPIFTVIFFMVGVICLFALNLVSNNGFIGGGATILWLLVAIVLLLIKGVKRN